MLYVYIGAVIEQRYMGTYKYVEWYDTDFKTQVIRFLIVVIITQPLALTMYFTSRDNEKWVLILLRVVLPQLLVNVFWFGPMKYVLMKMGLTNNTVHDCPPIFLL